MSFDSYIGHLDEQALAWARRVHQRICGPLNLDWKRKGTWIEAWKGKRRIAFAPHDYGAAFYFRGPEAVRSYLDAGGVCPTGKVCIKVPIGCDYEAELIRFVVLEHLGSN
jgi:hypothetical protein